MGRKRHGPEQVIAKLREAEVHLAKGQTAAEVCRALGITEQTYYLYGLLPACKSEVERCDGRLAYLYSAS